MRSFRGGAISALFLLGPTFSVGASPSQEVIEQAVLPVAVTDRYKLLRGATLIESNETKWWVAVAGRPQRRGEPDRLIDIVLRQMIKSSIAIAAFGNNPYCAHFTELSVTQKQKVNGVWVAYGALKANNLKEASTCDDSKQMDLSVSDEKIESFDSFLPQMPVPPKKM